MTKLQEKENQLYDRIEQLDKSINTDYQIREVLEEYKDIVHREAYQEGYKQGKFEAEMDLKYKQ